MSEKGLETGTPPFLVLPLARQPAVAMSSLGWDKNQSDGKIALDAKAMLPNRSAVDSVVHEERLPRKCLAQDKAVQVNESFSHKLVLQKAAQQLQSLSIPASVELLPDTNSIAKPASHSEDLTAEAVHRATSRGLELSNYPGSLTLLKCLSSGKDRARQTERWTRN